MKHTVIQYLIHTIGRYGDKKAIIDGEKQLTFRELSIQSKKIGYYLHLNYQFVGKPVAVVLPKSLESIIAFMGILYSGNFYAPIDEHLPVARVKSIIDNLEPMAVLTTWEYEEKLLAAGINPQKLVIIDSIMSGQEEYDDDVLKGILDKVIDADPVYIIYTSGSTGVPKGVVIPHRGVIDYIDWAISSFAVHSETIIGNQSPFYFDNSTLDIYLCLATGATLVLIPAQHFVFPAKLMEYVSQMKINFIFWVPFVLANIANRRVLEQVTPTSLRKILFAGEVMANKHLNYWRKHIPHALYANLYGPTEITVDCTYYMIDRQFTDCEPLPIGIPCLNRNILVLNADNQLVKGKEMGELCVRGSSLALGYWNDLEKTKAVFVQNPLHNHYPDLIYHTGDMVHYNEYGEIVYVSRKDYQIKHRGYRIELSDIENGVLSLADVEHACVLYNANQQEIILIYSASKKLGIEGIRKELALLLPNYMLPTQTYQVDELPTNANGKIDRTVLAGQYGR